MNELQRMEYMEALGVDTYVPRLVLPGAAASVQASLPVAALAKAAANTPPVAPLSVGSSSPITSAAGTAALLGDLVAQTTGRNAPLAPRELVDGAVSRAENASADAEVRFTLNIWRVNRSLLIVDSHKPKAALPTAALLLNMLRAKSLRQPLPGADSLQWPMFEHIAQWGGLGEAREMVNAFLQSRLELQPVKYIWLMGQDAFDAVSVTPGEYPSNIGAALNLEPLNCTALVMPSLADMLNEPALKPLAWQAISAHIFND